MNNKRGFTLIELLIALAVVALMIGIGLPSVKRIFRTNLKSAATRISSFIRFAYDSSIIKHKMHRIVFDFEKKEYWLEISSKDSLVTADIEKEEQDLDAERISDKEKKEEAKTKDKTFNPYPGEAGKKQKLPAGIGFEDIENLTTLRKISADKTYLYFFPNGQTEPVIIRLNGGTTKAGYYSIKVNPINAKTKIEGRYSEK